MEFTFDSADNAFRAEVRAFFEQYGGSEPDEERPDFDLERAMAKHGWLTMAWPIEYGGRGATHMQQVIFKEEIYRAGASFDFLGVNLAGPTIMVHGSEALRRQHLPEIAAAEVRWCQGFSEPGAGSDLASLQTRALRDGDDFIINGQKIWTSGAHLADWMLLLTRTDADAPKHKGITMFAVDMRTPGITVRPLIQITGRHGFNEVFLEDVRVPASNMIGELNRGWYVATTTLDFERSGIERNLIARKDWDRIRDWLATDHGRSTLPVHRAWRWQLTELYIEIEVGQWMARRIAYLQGKGRVPNYEASMSKAFNSEVGQRVSELGINIFGLSGTLHEGPRAAMTGAASFRYLDARRLSVGQGTSEIQRNIIATRGLGLPRG